MHQSERAFRAHATGPQLKRRAGRTGSCCRGAGHDEGEKDGSKGLPGQNFSKGLYSLLPRHGVHRVCAQDGVLENTQTLGRSQSQVDVCRDAHSNRGSKLTPHSLTPCRKAYARRTLPVTDVRVEELRGRFLEDWCEAHAAARDVTLCRNTCRTVPPTEPKRRKRKEEKGAHVCTQMYIHRDFMTVH